MHYCWIENTACPLWPSTFILLIPLSHKTTSHVHIYQLKVKILTKAPAWLPCLSPQPLWCVAQPLWWLSSPVASLTADFYQAGPVEDFGYFGREGWRLSQSPLLVTEGLGLPSASHSHSYIVTHYNRHWVGQWDSICVSGQTLNVGTVLSLLWLLFHFIIIQSSGCNLKNIKRFSPLFRILNYKSCQ